MLRNRNQFPGGVGFVRRRLASGPMHDKFGTPHQLGAGDASTKPKQVDSVAEVGSNAGQMTLGIYEIIDSSHKRAC